MDDERIQYEVEYVLGASPQILYNYIGTPGGLSKWFADNVTLQNGDIYSFHWEGSEEKAKLISKQRNKHITFQWLQDEGSDRKFSFHISKDSLTNDTVMIVKDTCFSDEQEESRELWDCQIDELRRLIGLK